MNFLYIKLDGNKFLIIDIFVSINFYMWYIDIVFIRVCYIFRWILLKLDLDLDIDWVLVELIRNINYVIDGFYILGLVVVGSDF